MKFCMHFGVCIFVIFQYMHFGDVPLYAYALNSCATVHALLNIQACVCRSFMTFMNMHFGVCILVNFHSVLVIDLPLY